MSGPLIKPPKAAIEMLSMWANTLRFAPAAFHVLFNTV